MFTTQSVKEQESTVGVAARIRDLMPSVERHGNLVRDVYDRLEPVPGGRALFTHLLGWFAPYTGTMGARILELRPGYSRVALADRRRVRNHLRSIHAIALVNLAELTGNIALAYSLPDDARFIVAGLSIDYDKKARGIIEGECHCPIVDSSERATFEVPVVMRDRAGEVVARATLRTLVGPKKRP